MNPAVTDNHGKKEKYQKKKAERKKERWKAGRDKPIWGQAIVMPDSCCDINKIRKKRKSQREKERKLLGWFCRVASQTKECSSSEWGENTHSQHWSLL